MHGSCRRGRAIQSCGLAADGLGVEFWDHPRVLVFVGLFSIPLYVKLGRIFFGERFESLGESIRYWLTPDRYSFLIGELRQDWAATFRLELYLALCFLWAAAVTELLARLFL